MKLLPCPPHTPSHLLLRLLYGSTPRRFGKTFSCARCPCHSLACVLTTPLCAWQHRHLLRVPCACIWPRDSRLFSSPSRVPQAARADRRVASTAQTSPGRTLAHACTLSWQVCATGRRRQAHLRVQSGAPCRNHRPFPAGPPTVVRVPVRRRPAVSPRSMVASRSSVRSRVRWG